MARRHAKPRAEREVTLFPPSACWECQQPLVVVYHRERRIWHLEGLCRYTLVTRRCHNPRCARYQVSVGPVEEGALALPHGEVGLDVIALA